MSDFVHTLTAYHVIFSYMKRNNPLREELSDDQNANEIVYGVDSYAYIFERMINSIFGNRDATKFNPSADWYLTIDIIRLLQVVI